MVAFASAPWPWYVAGPMIGLFVPVLLILGNRLFGVSSTLRDVCAIVLPRKIDFFHYDWKRKDLWNLLFVGNAERRDLGADQTGLGEARHSRLLRVRAARGLHMVGAAHSQGICLGHCGRVSGRLRDGICRRVHFRSCDLGSCQPPIPVVDCGARLLCRWPHRNSLHSSAALLRTHAYCNFPFPGGLP